MRLLNTMQAIEHNAGHGGEERFMELGMRVKGLDLDTAHNV